MHSELAEAIRDKARDGWSHRQLAAFFEVSLRQVQTAIDPEMRRLRDRRNERYRRAVEKMKGGCTLRFVK